MKSSHLLVLSAFAAAGAHGDILSDLSPFLGSSRPDYDSASHEPETATENPGYTPFSPADSDLGIQQILGKYQGIPPVKLALETNLNFTSNAPGVFPYDEGESWYSATKLNVSWSPRIAYGWFADLGLTQEMFRFTKAEAVDFENFEPHAGIFKSIPDLDDLIFFTRYEYQRISTHSFSDTDYSAQRIRTGFQKDLFATAEHQLSAGIDAAFDITASDDDEKRNEYTAGLAYTRRFAHHLSSTISWTGAMSDFRNEGREDMNHTLGLELRWTPCRNAVVYTNAFYTNHDSNSPFGANDFEAWQTGLGVGANFSF